MSKFQIVEQPGALLDTAKSRDSTSHIRIDRPCNNRPRAVEMSKFQPGQSGNPRGRPKGSRHRLSEKFLANLSDLWDEEGEAALRLCLVEDPAAFCRIVASLLPKQSEKIENPLDGL